MRLMAIGPLIIAYIIGRWCNIEAVVVAQVLISSVDTSYRITICNFLFLYFERERRQRSRSRMVQAEE